MADTNSSPALGSGDLAAVQAQDPAATVEIPVTWNDADRDAGIDWWIANATYWHEQAHERWRNRDEAADLQRRIDRTVHYLATLLDGPLDATTARVCQAAIEGLTMPTGRAPAINPADCQGEGQECYIHGETCRQPALAPCPVCGREVGLTEGYVIRKHVRLVGSRPERSWDYEDCPGSGREVSSDAG